MSAWHLLMRMGRPRKVEMDLSWLYDEQKTRRRVSVSQMGMSIDADSLCIPRA